MHEVAEALRKNVRCRREHLGLTQQQVAAQLTTIGAPLHQTAVAKIESGARQVTAEELSQLAVVLKTSACALLADAPLVRLRFELARAKAEVERLEAEVKRLESADA